MWNPPAKTHQDVPPPPSFLTFRERNKRRRAAEQGPSAARRPRAPLTRPSSLGPAPAGRPRPGWGAAAARCPRGGMRRAGGGCRGRHVAALRARWAGRRSGGTRLGRVWLCPGWSGFQPPWSGGGRAGASRRSRERPRPGPPPAPLGERCRMAREQVRVQEQVRSPGSREEPRLTLGSWLGHELNRPVNGAGRKQAAVTPYTRLGACIVISHTFLITSSSCYWASSPRWTGCGKPALSLLSGLQCCLRFPISCCLVLKNNDKEIPGGNHLPGLTLSGRVSLRWAPWSEGVPERSRALRLKSVVLMFSAPLPGMIK